jgi:hypothetical protein
MSYPSWLLEERMLIKYSNCLSKLGYKPRHQGQYGYTQCLMAVTPPMQEADKAKKEIQKTDNPEAWLLIVPYNIKPL